MKRKKESLEQLSKTLFVLSVVIVGVGMVGLFVSPAKAEAFIGPGPIIICGLGGYKCPAGTLNVINVPVRPCVVEHTVGAEGKPAGSYASGKILRDAIIRADDNTWLKYARIMFYPTPSLYGIPVIKDTWYPDWDGEVDVGIAEYSCRQAWEQAPLNRDLGIPVIEAHGINAGQVAGGYPWGILNHFTPGQPDYERLCTSPRKLTTADVEQGWIGIVETGPGKVSDSTTYFSNTLAHEFGHSLLLGHGNGLDDNHDGLEPITGLEEPPINNGTRRFDWCDPLGDHTGVTYYSAEDALSTGDNHNLMITYGNDSLTPLQIEQARAVAKVMPGATSSNNPNLPAYRLLVILTPNTINPGGTMTVEATGLTPNALADVYMADRLLASVQTDDTGAAQADVIVPSIAAQGLHPVVVELRGTAMYAVAPLLVKGDQLAPATQVRILPDSHVSSWNNGSVTLAFSATGVPGGADIASIHYSATGAQSVAPTTVAGASASLNLNAEGETTVTYFAEDSLGKQESPNNIVIKIDATAPAISGSVSPEQNSKGWNNQNVTVEFTCTDQLSGILSCTGPTTLIDEGKDLSVSGKAIDFAGNTATTSVGGINIDKTPPVITINTPTNGSEYLLNQPVLADWSVNDPISGIASSKGTVPNGAAIDTSSVGPKIFTVNATDNAGNTATVTANYNVVYKFSGILSPFKSNGDSSFNQGSTVPIKFQLQDANGNYISTATASIYLVDASGKEINATPAGKANTGNLVRYDDTQYIYNLATKTLSKGIWTIRIHLDDGTVREAHMELT